MLRARKTVFIIEGKKYLVFWVLAPVLLGLGFEYFRDNEMVVDWIGIGFKYYVLLISVVIHEIFHGLAAEACGDVTARKAGRLTFNLVKHISVVGSILVPLGLYFMNSGIVLGWAKGVPFNPARLRRFPRDQVFLSVMGPLSNFALAFICFFFFVLAGLVYYTLHPETPFNPALTLDFDYFRDLDLAGGWFILFHLLSLGVFLNVVLGIFNLIPFPPLDGSWILKSMLPGKLAHYFNKLQPFAFIILIAAVYMGLLEYLIYPIINLMTIFMTVSDLIWNA